MRRKLSKALVLDDFSLSYKSGYAKKSYNNKLYGKFLYSGNTTVNVVGTWYP